MAQIDNRYLQLTIGIVGVDGAPVDLLVHQGRKLGIDRETLEAVPVVRFGLRPVVLERSLVVVMSAAPLDVVQADAVIAVNDGEPRLEDELDVYDLLPIVDVSTERLMSGAGRADSPEMLVLNAVGTSPRALAHLPSATIDLQNGEGISPAINALLDRVTKNLAAGTREPRACPTIILHATHKATTSADLQPDTFPKPGARLALRVSLHEPFGDDWSCRFEGRVDEVDGLHQVVGTVAPAGEAPESLAGRWRVELFRERDIWILRSMQRA
jgi:hypothetical protein